MRRPILGSALLLLTIAFAITMIESGFCYTFGCGQNGIGTTIGDYVLLNGYNISVPSGYRLVVTKFYVYADNTSSDCSVHGAVFDSDYKLIAETEDIAVTGLDWYSAPLDCTLLTGLYYLGAGIEATGNVRYVGGSGSLTGYFTGYGFDASNTWTAFGDDPYCMYVEYDFEPLIINAASGISSSEFLLVMFMLIGAFLLMFIPRIPIINFVFGIFSLAIAAVTLTSEGLPYTPYINLLLGVAAALCMLSAAIRLQGE